MKHFRIVCLAAASCLSLAAAAPALAADTAAAAQPPSAADFANAPRFDSVQLAPDGKHLAAMTSPDGQTTAISIWSTEDMSKPPVVIPSAGQERIIGFEFIKNDRLSVTLRQTLDLRPPFPKINGHLFKIYILDIAGKSLTPALPEKHTNTDVDEVVQALSNPAVLSTLPRDPKHILVESTRSTDDSDLYLVDIYRGSAERLEHGSDKFGSMQADLNGEIRARQEINYDQGKVYIIQWIKNPETKAWEEHFRWYAKDRESTDIVGFTPDPNIVYVASNKGRDKTAIYEYDIKNRKLLEPAFEHKLFDAGGVVFSHADADFGRPLGFTYQAETAKIYWIDPELAALDAQLKQALGVKTTTVDWTDPGTGQTSKIKVPDGFDVTIVSWSSDRKHVVVEKSGPKQPPEYYLYADGKLSLLGRSKPQISPAQLGDTRLVEYTARDGLNVPAFLTTPPKDKFGPGPYPAFVLPHGGPWARDDLGWDVSGWTQYFASRGYAVIQPQFRGSMGWGQKLWRAGDREWGQKMQDDNDDAAKWMIAQRIAAPDRIALFGYSYGGYAALAAAVRPNGLYQCTVAGAPVAELGSFRGETDQNRILREYQRPTIAGLDPLAHASQVSVPVLLIHGDRDQTVPYEQSKKMSAALQAAGRPYRMVTMKDMGHQFITMVPKDLETILTEVDKYFKNECGPGGL